MGTVYAAMELFAKPFVPEHLLEACPRLGSFAADAGKDMQKEWGGRRAFEDEDEGPGVQ